MARGDFSGKDASGAYRKVAPEDVSPTLADNDISYKESALATKIAALPEDKFIAIRDGKKTVTQVAREMKKEELANRPVACQGRRGYRLCKARKGLADVGDSVDTKIEDQKEFVRWWQETVRGKGEKANSADRGYFVDEAESITGIKRQQASRWR